MTESVWIGVDVGRQSHHAAAIDEHGSVLWSQKTANQQADIEQLVDRVSGTETVIALARRLIDVV